MPLDFDDGIRLRAALSGASVVYNTYWVRFADRGEAHGRAVAHSKILIEAALRERVDHFVHVSIANADQAPWLSYYRGKAEVEDYLRHSGLPFSIVRPTVLYGVGDILINNIAWFLRHLPVFGIPGDGSYRIQPVYVEDYADLIVGIGATAPSGTTIDAVGPDSYRFSDLIALVRSATCSHCMVLNVPPSLARFAVSTVGGLVRDTVLTREEIEGLMAGLLASRSEPTCPTFFAEWLATHCGGLGHRYASELARRR
jgi:NADH dehydrogenase